MIPQKFVRESLTTMTELVLPNDTNTLHSLMGGKMMHWMDIVSAIAAQKHSNRIVVTASVDNVSFTQAIKLGNVVTLRAQVTRAFTSSMEVFIEVWGEDIPAGQRYISNKAFFTFVAMDQNGKPASVPEVVPETTLPSASENFIEGDIMPMEVYGDTPEIEIEKRTFGRGTDQSL